MSSEGYPSDKKEGDNKVVLERLQSYLKDKRSSEPPEASTSYNKPGLLYEQPGIPAGEEGSNILRQILNYKKAELLRDPEITALLKSISASIKK